MFFIKCINYKNSLLLICLTTEKIRIWNISKGHIIIISIDVYVAWVLDDWEPANGSGSHDVTPPT